MTKKTESSNQQRRWSFILLRVLNNLLGRTKRNLRRTILFKKKSLLFCYLRLLLINLIIWIMIYRLTRNTCIKCKTSVIIYQANGSYCSTPHYFLHYNLWCKRSPFESYFRTTFNSKWRSILITADKQNNTCSYL